MSGKVTTGSHPPPPPVSSVSTRFSTDFLRALKCDDDDEDMFFISEILDLSSVRSDFMDDAFLSLLDDIWCTLCEEDVEEDEHDVLATLEELLLFDSI